MTSWNISNLRQQRLLDTIRRWHFNPFVSNITEAKEWLTSRGVKCPSGASEAIDWLSVGDAVACSGTAVVVTALEPMQTEEVLIQTNAPRATPVKDQTGATRTTVHFFAESIAKQGRLVDFHGWDVEFAELGEVFTTRFVADQPCCFVTACGYRVDLIAYDRELTALYSGSPTHSWSTTIRGLTHSGNDVVQTISAAANYPRNSPVVMALVGDRCWPLARYDVPLAICVPCPAERVVRVVACPRSAGMSDYSMACLVTAQRVSKDALQWAVTPRPHGVAYAHKSTVTVDVADAVKQTLTDAHGVATAANTSPVQTPTSPLSADHDEGSQSAYTRRNSSWTAVDYSPYHRVVFIDESLRKRSVSFPEVSADTLVVSFGSGLTVGASRYSSEDAAAAPCAPLPCITGSLCGWDAAATGVAYTSPLGVAPQQYLHALQHAALRVVHCSGTLPFESPRTIRMQLNGIFVIHPSQLVFNDRASLERSLAWVPMEAVDVMAGPQSIVVAHWGERRYLLRCGHEISTLPWGPQRSLSGELRTMLRVGDDVTELFDDEALFRNTSAWKTVFTRGLHDTQAPLVDFPVPRTLSRGGIGITIDEAVRAFDNFKVDELNSYRAPVRRLLMQSQSLPPSQLAPILIRLKSRVEQLVAMEVAGEEANFRSAAAAAGDSFTFVERVASAGRALQGVRMTATQRVRWLLDDLAACASVRGACCHHEIIKRQQRKTARTAACAAEMTWIYEPEELWGLLDAACAADVGCMVAHAYTRQWSNGVSCTDWRFDPQHLFIDAHTVQALANDVRQVDKKWCVTVKGTNGQDAVFIPIMKCFVECRDIIAADLHELRRRPDVAQLQSLLRDTIEHVADATSSRINLLFAALHAATSSMGSVSNCVPVVRGLFGLILTHLAAVHNPLSSVSRLFQASSTAFALEAPDKAQWAVYVELVSAYSFTQWPTDALRGNLQRLVVTLLMKAVHARLEGVRMAEHNGLWQQLLINDIADVAANRRAAAAGSDTSVASAASETDALHASITVIDSLMAHNPDARVVKAVGAAANSALAQVVAAGGTDALVHDNIAMAWSQVAGTGDVDWFQLLKPMLVRAHADLAAPQSSAEAVQQRVFDILRTARRDLALQLIDTNDASHATFSSVERALAAIDSAECSVAIRRKAKRFVRSIAGADSEAELLRVVFGGSLTCGQYRHLDTLLRGAIGATGHEPALQVLRRVVLWVVRHWRLDTADDQMALALFI
jgi:hypothetical protein